MDGDYLYKWDIFAAIALHGLIQDPRLSPVEAAKQAKEAADEMCRSNKKEGNDG